MNYVIYVKRAYIELDEDSYENGEGAFIAEWDLDELVGLKFKDAQMLLYAVKSAEPCFTSDLNDYVYLDSTIQTDATVYYDEMGGSLEKPSKEQMEQFRKGQINLVNAHLWVRVEMIPYGESHPMTEDEAEAFGLPIY